VNRRIQRRLGFRAVHALQNDRIITHGPTDKTTLARKRRRRALADYPEVFAIVCLTSGIVMVVMESLCDGPPMIFRTRSTTHSRPA